MKKLFILLLFPLSIWAQTPSTDSNIKLNTDYWIRKARTITPTNHAAINDQLTDSKVSILAPKLLTSSTSGYVWTATDNQGNGSWQVLPAGVTQFQLLTDGPGTFSGHSLNYSRVNSLGTLLEYRTPSQTLSDISGVPTSRILTINGTALDLSADRSWTVAGGVTSFNSRTGAISPQSGDYSAFYLPLTGANLTTDFLVAAGIGHNINFIGGSAGGGVVIKAGTIGGSAQMVDDSGLTGFTTSSGEASMYNTSSTIDIIGSTSINISSTGVGFKGFVYAADYSANYVAQSLTDKNYNDTHFKGLTFSNSPLTNQVANYNGTNWTFSSVTNAMIANSTIDLTAKVTGILPVANGGTGTTTPGIVAGSNITVSGTWPNQTVSASGAATPWSLASGGTLTGANTITSNTANQLLFNGTWTATANNQNHIQFGGTITSENVASDNLNYFVLNPTIARNAGNPATQTTTAVLINPTFSNSFATQYLIRAQSGGVDKFNVTDGGNLSTVGTISSGSITSGGSITIQTSGSFTMGTGSALIGSSSNNAKLYVSQQALSSSQIPAFRVDVGAHTAIASTSEYNLSKITAATLTWTDGTTAIERVNFDDAITLNGTTTLATFTDAYGRYTAAPIAGAKGAITRNWGLGTNGNLQVQGSGFFGAVSVAPTAFIHAAGATTSNASIRVGSGTAPTSPNQGDLWNDGTNLFFYSSSQKNAVASNFSIAAPATTGTMTTTLTNVSTVTITPTGSCTFNASGGIAGSDCTFVITTSGTSAFTLTWGTNFKSTGTLSTGTVNAKVFTVSFRYDGTNWNETARTPAM